MSIEQTQVVDGIGVDKKTGELLLIITDHLNWNDNPDDHLMLLQEKINAYLSFVESGELLEAYPDSKDRSIIVNVVGKYPLADVGINFFAQAGSVIEDAGIKLRFELFEGKQDGRGFNP